MIYAICASERRRHLHLHSSSPSHILSLAAQVSFKLPGEPHAKSAGIWTAIWIMGNLARDVYPASVENIWPFTYDACQCPGPVSKPRNGTPMRTRAAPVLFPR